MEFLSYLVMFCIGWICSSIWTYLFNLGTTAVMMQNVTYATACYIKLLHETSLKFIEVKYDGLREGVVDENSIKILRNEDAQTISSTQQVLVDLMIEKYPKGFSHLLEFSNWREMNNYIRKYQKE